MDNANLEFNLDASSAEGQTESTPQAQPQATTPQAFSLDDVKKLLQEQSETLSAKFSTELQEVKRQKDRARETAYRKAGAFEKEYAPILKEHGIELDAKQMQNVKRSIVDKEFDAFETETEQPKPDAKPQPTAPTAPTQQDPKQMQYNAIAQVLQSKGVTAEQIGGIEKYLGMTEGSDLALTFDESLLNAQKQNRVNTQRASNATRREQELNAFGVQGEGTIGNAQGQRTYDPYGEDWADNISSGMLEMAKRRK